jgi:adenosylhomocysteine nucleosidase
MSKYLVVFLILITFSSCNRRCKYAVLISANMEWTALKKVYPDEKYQKSVWGEYFHRKVSNQDVLFFHEGWGKVSAAGATQFVIDTYNPEIFINLGTCGGFEGKIGQYDIILADKTVIYDISEAMGDSKEAITDYTTTIDLSWLGNNFPSEVHKTTLVSADKDLRPNEIDSLNFKYAAVAGDWETGAIAYVAVRNNKKILILRGVSDLVNTSKGEAYGNFNLFISRTDTVMNKLLTGLPLWIDYIESIPINK